MRRILFVLVLLIVGRDSYSQPFWSTGPKIGYTFGKDGGITAGWEFSYFPNQSTHGILIGYTLDLTSWHDHASLHLGLEGPMIDVGPTLFFFSDRSSTIGLSVIPWVGLIFYAYYEFAWPFGESPFHTVGGYFKIPVGYQFSGFG